MHFPIPAPPGPDGWATAAPRRWRPDYADADLLVFVGATRSDVASDGYTRGFDAETIIVGLDPEATQHAGRIDQQILASPRSFVTALTSSMPLLCAATAQICG